jgi:hypothetical protein
MGKSFPCFGEGEVEKTFGVTQEVRVGGARRLSFGSGHRNVLALHLRDTLTDEPALLLAKVRWEIDRRSEINRQKSAKNIAFSRRGRRIEKRKFSDRRSLFGPDAQSLAAC